MMKYGVPSSRRDLILRYSNAQSEIRFKCGITYKIIVILLFDIYEGKLIYEFKIFVVYSPFLIV